MTEYVKRKRKKKKPKRVSDIEIALDRRGKQLCARAKTVSGESNVYGNTRCDAPDAEHYLTAYFSTVSGDIEIR